jgi:hypothetical protein
MSIRTSRAAGTAVEMLDPPMPIDQSVRDGIVDLRDMLEHWPDNMPVFNQQPRTRQPAVRRFHDRPHDLVTED